MIRDRIERLLNVRPGEWGDLLFFWIFNALLWTGLSIGESVSETLFLKRLGVEFLPHMFIGCSIFAIPISFLFSAFQGRIGRVKMAIWLGASSTVAVLISLFLIRSQYEVFGVPVGFPALYIIQNTLATVLATHFSILVSGQFNTLNAKRLIPLILSGSVAGSMTGGILISMLAKPLGVENLLWVWVVLLVLSLAWFLVFCIKIFPANWVGEEKDTSPKYMARTWTERMVFETKAVFGSPLLILLAMSTLLMTLSKFFIEYQYSEIFGSHFHVEADLAKFFGQYTVISNILALLFQGFITSRIIQNFGVSNSNLFYPCSTFFAFLGTAVSYSLWPGVFARFNQEGFRRAVFQPVSNLFYNAIPTKRRAWSIAFNEGIVVPVGSVLAGLALMVLKDSHLAMAIITISFSFGWIILSWGQREVYSQSLLDLLKRSQIENLPQDDKGIGRLDAQTQILVIEALKNEQDEVAELAADLLIKYGSAGAKHALLRQAATCRNSLQIILLRRLVSFPGLDTKAFFMKALTNPEDDVKLAALEALVCYPHDEEIRLRISEFLEYPDIRHQSLAAAAVVRGGDLVQMMKALMILQRLLFSKIPEEVVLGIRCLGETRDERFWVNLRSYLASPKPELRLAAMRSMNLMVQTGEIYEHLETLRFLIKDTVREIRSHAIQIIGRVKVSQSISLLMDALSDSSPRNRRLAFEALSNFGPEIIPDLLMLLDDPRASVHAQETAVRLLNFSQDPQIRDRLGKFGMQQIRTMYEYKIDENTIRKELPPCEGEYIASILHDKAQALVRLILALVAPEQNQAARTLFKNLYSANQEMMSNAIEVLQMMGERTLIYHILPILEGLPLEKISEYGRRVFSLENRNPRLVLGRYLLAIDGDLKEAAIFTIGKIGMIELESALRKIRQVEGETKGIQELCEWALDHLSKGGIFSNQRPSLPRPAET